MAVGAHDHLDTYPHWFLPVPRHTLLSAYISSYWSELESKQQKNNVVEARSDLRFGGQSAKENPVQVERECGVRFAFARSGTGRTVRKSLGGADHARRKCGRRTFLSTRTVKKTKERKRKEKKSIKKRRAERDHNIPSRNEEMAPVDIRLHMRAGRTRDGGKRRIAV
ncbi:hypothetical protein MPTK1_3g08680 [Marchantia polymorpha subsp. ruderalis]|uniref:Uncharacterized protein n=2 Tax=Marchantia polymorpha TaxID=3197 RepID=A0A176WNN4_MARPO|nr:hypothetical protein AXG93_2528s1260 [Marchantia polymorpha subsp. ruderalis]PTQ31939.1 hypothetical protein MARPO_0105s0049 [Marchantia polymorpha]BBN04905.1 hypothetical protein Mp_3g08680 [Marchantia polymorpha subsp. ruderalis]|eukprot:PTQ31939.1 hypothetical protein MARPO_0105s0049 [Marchantia polymorpha]